MKRRLVRWASFAAAAGLTVGCQSSSNYPSAPLLSSKRPVAGKTGASEPVQVASAEPKAPEIPPQAMAALDPDHEPAATLGLPPGSVRPSDPDDAPPPRKKFHTVGRPRGPAEATPTSRSPAGPSLGDSPSLEGKINGKYGHAEDYSWLQGVLEKHYRGHYFLRFCDHATRNQHGGKVFLDNDPALAQFKDGDVIYIEGNVDTEPDSKRHEAWRHYPRYRIRSAKLVEHKE